MTDWGSALLEAVDQTALGSSQTMRGLLTRGFAGILEKPSVDQILDELGRDDVDSFMQDLIPLARVYSTPAISDYRVGAVAHGRSGNLYLGFNMEYSGMSLGDSVHGEQAAVTNAWSRGESRITKIATSAAPCGHCRQFLFETDRGADMSVLTGAGRSTLLASLLPNAFGPQDLGFSSRLMAKTPKARLNPAPKRRDALAGAVFQAARQSYAPYSKGFAAVGLETNIGGSVIGRYAENAAFNPSLAPMAAALVLLRLRGDDPREVRRAVLVHADSAVDHASKSRAMLASVGGPQLEILTVRVGHMAEL